MKKIILFSVFAFSSVSSIAQMKISSATFGNYDARQIGPAVMGGRISAIEVVNKDPRTFYVGAAGGGIWKTTNAGSSFKPIFDKYCQSIGDMRIDQQRPDTIWVGTGESNMRNSVSIGNGIYKTTDGGDNWSRMGLDSTEHISKIQINPKNPDVVYVAVPGPLWSDSKHRGLYKTTDGGKTWNKILYVDEKTGCADVMIDPTNPDVIYASTWQFRRTAYSFNSGGKGSALHKSTDGGKTWKKIQNGFDGEELGRIILAMSPKETNTLYAIAESKNTALYKSTNGGDKWEKKSASQNVTWRPFYFSLLVVDPTNSNRLYRPSLGLSFSNDGGETFIDASFEGGWVHSDHHALWIDPNMPTHLLLGTDGGLYQSLDRGNSWTFLNKLPVSQFYHVAIDNQTPYNVMGGLQDNGSWVAPSSTKDGVANRHWDNLYYGDGFWMQPDLSEPNNVFYAESQGGDAARIDRKNNESRSIKPLASPGDPKLRFNWNTPIYVSPNNPKTIYMGAQFLYKSTNRGDAWQKISGDLTTNDPLKQQQEKSGGLSVDNSSAENHCTIFTLTEAPGDGNTVWVGTDDGNLQLTTDAGKTWTNLTKNVTGLPKNTWVSSINVSTYDKNTVFVTFEGHTTGDMKPYVYKTTDNGKTWANLAKPEIKSFCHIVKQDIVNPNILFVGTEMGLYVSLDGGQNWAEWTANISKTPVRDIQIHPNTNDVILATHGRGIIIIDDITPLRNLTKEVLDAEFTFLPNRKAYIGNQRYGGGMFLTGEFSAPSANEDAVITYYLKDRISGDAKLEILDASGKVITSLPVTKRKGINTLSWDMRQKAPRVAKAVKIDVSGFVGPLVPEGDYTLKFYKGTKVYESKLQLMYDPSSPFTKEDRSAQADAVQKVFNMQEELAYVNEQVVALRDTLKSLIKRNETNKALVKELASFKTKLDDLTSIFAAQIEGTAITGEEKLRENIGKLYYGIVSFKGKPSDQQLENIKKLSAELTDAKKKTDETFKTNLVKVNALLEKNKIAKLELLTQAEFDKLTKK